MILEIAVGAIILFIIWQTIFNNKPNPFHIDVPSFKQRIAGINIFPFIHKVFTLLPESTRRNAVSKKLAPYGVMRDRFDILGESPYTVSEVIEGKVWKVAYQQELNLLTDKEVCEGFRGLGLDFMSENFEETLLRSASKYGDDIVKIAKQDLDTVRSMIPKLHSCCNELPKDTPYLPLNSYVIKLDSGSLLLYAPVTVRDEVKEFADWLAGLGKVTWIVIGSGSHTLHLRAIIERYPHAKVIGPRFAEEKVKHVMQLPRGKFDFHTTDKESLREANEILKSEGCEVFSIQGDSINTVLLKVEKVLFTCDLNYGHYDGEGSFFTDKERFRKGERGEFFIRLFKLALIDNSPNGMLPNYRFWFMDPNSLSIMSYERPDVDGSSCKMMAEGLRSILKLDVDVVADVHTNEMSGEEWKKTIDKSWNWLDGHTLLD